MSAIDAKTTSSALPEASYKHSEVDEKCVNTVSRQSLSWIGRRDGKERGKVRVGHRAGTRDGLDQEAAVIFRPSQLV